MIHIVQSHSIDLSNEPGPTRRAQNLLYGGPQRAVLSFQQLLIRAPGRLVGSAFFRPRKKITPLQSKRASLSTLDASPHRVFPIRRVQCLFPYVVSPRSRPPGSLLGAYPPDRLPQIGPVPRFLPVSLVEQPQNQFLGLHGYTLFGGALAAASPSSSSLALSPFSRSPENTPNPRRTPRGAELFLPFLLEDFASGFFSSARIFRRGGRVCS